MADAFIKVKVVVLRNEVAVSPTVQEKLSQINFDDSIDEDDKEDDDNDVNYEYKDSNNLVSSENCSCGPQYANKQSEEITIQNQKNIAVVSSYK